MKKLKLDDQSYSGFRGLGIVSPEKDYRLSFFLNKELGTEFKKIIGDVADKMLETGRELEKEFPAAARKNAARAVKKEPEERLSGLFIYDPSKNKRLPIICFVHTHPEKADHLYLAKNKQDGFYLMPGMKIVDYIFLEPEEQEDTLKNLKTTLTKFQFIQSCFLIPEANLKYIDAE